MTNSTSPIPGVKGWGIKSAEQLAIEDLERSGLTKEDMATLGMEALSAAQVQAQFKMDCNCLLIPYYDLNRQPTKFFRLRLYSISRDQKYHQQKGTGIALYLPPNVDWRAVLADPSIPIYVTEGEKKAAKASKDGLFCVGLGGVDSSGSKRQEIELLPELALLAENGRIVYVVFDGDIVSKPPVKRAQHTLAKRLFDAGARVRIKQLPPDGKLDDFLVAHGAEAFHELPVREWSVRDQLSALRYAPMRGATERARTDQITNIVTNDLLAKGRFYRAGDEVFYFHDVNKRLYELGFKTDDALRTFLNAEYDVNAATNEFSFVYEHLRAHAAQHGSETTVHVFSHWDGEALYIDSGDCHIWKIKATSAKPELLPNGGDGVLFRSIVMEPIRPSAAQPIGNVVRDLLGRANYDSALPRDQLLLALEVWFYAMLFPELHPTKVLLLLWGPKGSRKSSVLKAVNQMLLGGDASVLTFKKDSVDDLWSEIEGVPFLPLDNLDGSFKDLENFLAVACTGGVHARRKLYTDKGRVTFLPRAFLAATSREPISFTRDDVVDRLFVVPCERTAEFRAESELLDELRELRPLFWAYLFATLPRVIAALRAHESEAVTDRMADFSNFGLALAPALGVGRDAMLAALGFKGTMQRRFVKEMGTLSTIIDNYLGSAEDGAMPVKDYVTATTLYTCLKATWPEDQRFPFASGLSLAKAIAKDLPESVEVVVDGNTKNKKYRLVRS